jgi:alpha-D-ribose 1-methylphosphonate 5-triphosphate synthase subunit PhnG
MALLARAPLPLLEAGLGELAHTSPMWLRAPETGLMMVQGRVGGSGERFNLGEVTITRCTLRLDAASQAVGVAHVLGRTHRQARLAAVADALLQDPRHHPRLCTDLLQPISQHLAAQARERSAEAQATQVAFFTVAREAGDGNDEEDNA